MTDELKARAREMMQMDSLTAGFGKSTPAPPVTIPNGPRGAMTEEQAKAVVSITFMSRTGGDRPHVVSVGFDGLVVCTCRASTPCWAVQTLCHITGRPVFS